ARHLFREYAAFLRGHEHGEIWEDFDKEMADLPGAYAPPAGRLLLAHDGARIAGCVAVRPLEEGICEMKRLFVRPEFCGKGLGRQLAQAAIAAARALGYERIRLDTLPSLTAALTMYQSLGFGRIGPYGSCPLPWAHFLELRLR